MEIVHNITPRVVYRVNIATLWMIQFNRQRWRWRWRRRKKSKPHRDSLKSAQTMAQIERIIFIRDENSRQQQQQPQQQQKAAAKKKYNKYNKNTRRASMFAEMSNKQATSIFPQAHTRKKNGRREKIKCVVTCNIVYKKKKKRWWNRRQQATTTATAHSATTQSRIRTNRTTRMGFGCALNCCFSRRRMDVYYIL